MEGALADNLGKFDEPGKLLTWHNLITVRLPANIGFQPDKTKSWPTEYMRKIGVLSIWDTGVTPYYTALGNWAERVLGIKIDNVVSEMENDLARNPIRLFN